VLRRFINILVDIIYPKICLACKSKLREQSCIETIVCAECWEKIKKNLPPFCQCCGRHLEKFTSKICPTCLRKQQHFDRAFSPCVYEGVIKELVHAFKYRNKDYLGLTLSRLMTEFIKEYNVPVDLLDNIIPIPLHKTRLREREFNQAEVLSNYISKEFRKTVLSNILMRHRYTKTQTGLKDNLRLLNVKGSFSIKQSENIRGKNILLVDDVLTTGSTASEAAYALKNAGANIVFVLTLAS
jgi:competence protein ComFC